MPEQLVFAMEVTLNGLMTGVMYSLVALGFVLIFKASGISVVFWFMDIWIMVEFHTVSETQE